MPIDPDKPLDLAPPRFQPTRKPREAPPLAHDPAPGLPKIPDKEAAQHVGNLLARWVWKRRREIALIAAKHAPVKVRAVLVKVLAPATPKEKG